jgi:hypothetical protein
MNISKIERLSSQAHARELLENELEKSSSRLELLEKEYDIIHEEHDEIHNKLCTKILNLRKFIHEEEKIIKKINKKIIKLKQIKNNIV